MGFLKSIAVVSWILIGLVGLESLSHAEFSDSLIQPVWAAADLNTAINAEIAGLDARKSAVITAYNNLGVKLNTYDGWCNTYGISALRNIIEGRLFMKLFSAGGFAAYHIYANDPYFSKVRANVDALLMQTRSTTFDLGKCNLVSIEATKMAHEPKQFDRTSDEFAGTFSNPYIVLTGNLRLIDEEREVLLELKGMIKGTGEANNSRTVEEFVQSAYGRLMDKTRALRARTLEGYEYSFRVPLGELEIYNGKQLGFKDTDTVPNFFWIFERRAFYVNQARVAAGSLFEESVKNFVAAETIQDKFLSIIREASTR